MSGEKKQHIAKKGVLSGQDLLLGRGRPGGQAPTCLATRMWRNGGREGQLWAELGGRHGQTAEPTPEGHDPGTQGAVPAPQSSPSLVFTPVWLSLWIRGDPEESSASVVAILPDFRNLQFAGPDGRCRTSHILLLLSANQFPKFFTHRRV